MALVPVVVTLALGIGATTAIFSGVRSRTTASLPYRGRRPLGTRNRATGQSNAIGYRQSLAGIWTRNLPVLSAAYTDAVAHRRSFSAAGNGRDVQI